jgi:hypothetical protein
VNISEKNSLLAAGINSLEALLSDQFGCRSAGFGGKVNEIMPVLPEDLAHGLADLDRLGRHLLGNDAADETQVGGFLFQCGCLHERLLAYRQLELAAASLADDTEGMLRDRLDQPQLDALSRFVEFRDRLLRTVADFTLKALLILLGLFVLGTFVGLI